MARGVDIWVGQIVLRLHQDDPKLCLIVTLPYPGCDSRWSASWRKQYAEVLKAADLVKASRPAYNTASFQKLVARYICIVEVSGSNPLCSTTGLSGGFLFSPVCRVREKDPSTAQIAALYFALSKRELGGCA